MKKLKLKNFQPSEQEIKKAILSYLRLNGIVAWVNNVGAVKIPFIEKRTKRLSFRFVKFGVKGQADITGILPDGRRLEIEVKTPAELKKIKLDKVPESKRKHIEEQKEFLAMINKNNGVGFFASSVEDVFENLSEFLDWG